MRQVRDLYQVDQLPIFQNRMYSTEVEALACPKGDIRLVEDYRTGLIYNEAFQPELVAYNEHYQNEQAVSPYFRIHLEQVVEVIERSIGKQAIVEVGCGKGYFLEMLAARGFDITGFDPAYDGNNPVVVKQYFVPELEIRAIGIILRHVLEHIHNPVQFLLNLKEANGGSGKIYIEVPCFEWICEHKAWFDIFYEHVNYFRLNDFYAIFGTIYESGRLFGSQYIYVVAELASIRQPKYCKEKQVKFPGNFLGSLSSKETSENTKYSVVWGGASKGVIFTLLKARAGELINIVIDINPAKQGKYLPSTGVLIQSPSEALTKLPKDSTIYVMNSNYLEEIKTMSNNLFNYIAIDHE